MTEEEMLGVGLRLLSAAERVLQRRENHHAPHFRRKGKNFTNSQNLFILKKCTGS